MASRATGSRRLVHIGCLQCLQQPSLTSSAPIPSTRRTIFNFFRRNRDNADGKPKDSFLDQYMKKKPTQQQRPEQGDLGSSSIFESERQAQDRETKDSAQEESTVTVAGAKRNLANMAAVLDPQPRNRERWQRKMVIREMQRGGRLSREQYIRRTERELLHKSQNFKTSVKKLAPLARQIQGKTVDEAIAQMRFSKKKAAKHVLETLEYARDEAVVSRGMGLGAVKASQDAGVADDLDGILDVEVVKPGNAQSTPIQIQLRDGKRHTVTDRTQIYVDQAYVGRGPFGQLPDYRARGRLFIMQTPWTHLSVKLKEEASRVRDYAEREGKRTRQRLGKVWTHLPDRPIQGQRQWYSW